VGLLDFQAVGFSRAWFVACVLSGAACSGRAPIVVGGDGDGDGTGTSDDTGTSGTSGTTGTTGTSETSETGDTSWTTTATSTSTSDSDTTEGPRFDLGILPDSNPDYDPQPCPEALEGTDIAGDTPLGPFAGKRAWFAGDEDYVRLIVFDDTADVVSEAEFAHYNNGELEKGPALVLEANPYKGIPLTEPTAVLSFAAPDSENFMAELTIDELVYGQDQMPELLRGSIALWPDENAEGVVGKFEAGFCLNYTYMFWGE
jgi:hypothetical protein